MAIPLLDLKAQYYSIKDELDSAMLEALGSTAYILGPKVQEFEKAIAAYCGAEHAIGVANGTDALVLALDAVGIKPGDEVITSTYTFFASGECVSRLGATPVFVDVDPDTYNLAPEQVKAKITSKTKAIIPVHIFGQPAEMDEINAIAGKHELKVIEDACQAIGTHYRGRKIGTLGDAACFSFFPSKNLGCAGDGGLVTTNNQEIADKVRALRTHGSTRKYYHSMIGYNSRLDALQAAMLSVKLKYIDTWNDARRERAAIYEQLFAGTDVKTPVAQDYVRHVYHQYVVSLPDRAAVEAALKANQIGHAIYYPVPLHLQDVYLGLGYKQGDMPVSEKASVDTLALPIYPELTLEQQQIVADTVKQAIASGLKC